MEQHAIRIREGNCHVGIARICHFNEILWVVLKLIILKWGVIAQSNNDEV